MEIFWKLIGVVDVPKTKLTVNFEKMVSKYTFGSFFSWEFLENKVDKIKHISIANAFRCFDACDSLVRSINPAKLERGAIQLALMLAFTEAQPKGENGPLLTDGSHNVFFTYNCAGTLMAISCSWNGHYWCLSSYNATYPFTWSGRRRFFFPKKKAH